MTMKKKTREFPQKMTVQEAREMGLLSPKKSRSKYGNERSFYNGRWFDSKKEAKRAYELDVLVKAGEVRSWQAQPRFVFEYNGVKICTYVADFRVEYMNGKVEIEDVKGYKTEVYKLKKKMLKAFYGIEIREL